MLDCVKKYEKLLVSKGYIKPKLFSVPAFKVGQKILIKEIVTGKCTRKKECIYRLHRGTVVGVYKSFCNIVGRSGYRESINYRDIQTHLIEIYFI